MGDEITYEISFKNYKSTAADVHIKDQLDENVEFVSADNKGAYVKEDHTVIWTVPNVAANTEGKVTLTVKVLEGALVSKKGPGKVVNGGESTTVQIGNDHEYHVEKVENPVPEKPEKKETAPYEGTGELGGVKVGDEITYEISYKNYTAEAADVVIKDILDKNVKFVSASNGGAESGGVVTWTVNTPAGESGTVTVTVEVLASALHSNGGPGKVENGGDSTWIQIGNDTEYHVETTWNPVPEKPEKKETAPYAGTGILGDVRVDDKITYEISYRNYKSQAADVTIRDTLDANVAFVSASNGGTHSGEAKGGVVNWTIPSVPAGQAGKVTLTVRVLESALEILNGPGKVKNGGEFTTVKVGNDHEYEVNEVENPVPYSELTITKAFLFNGGKELPDDVTEDKLLSLEFTLTGPQWTEPQSLTYKDIKEGKTTYKNIVPGRYTLTEEEGAISLLADEHYTLDVAASTMSRNEDVKPNAPAVIELTNHYVSDAGSLVIAKEWCFSPVPVSEEDKQDVKSGMESLKVTITNSEGKYVQDEKGTLSDTKVELTIPLNGENKSRLVIENLPIDTYTVTETNADGLFAGLYALTSDAAQSVKVDVKNMAIATAVLKNNYEREMGELILQKTVSENVLDAEALSEEQLAANKKQLDGLLFHIKGVTDPSFEMTVPYSEFTETRVFNVKTKTVTVPVGTYTVEESNENTVLDVYTWVSGATMAENLKVTKDGAPRVAELENTYEETEGQLVIIKTFIGAPRTEEAEEAKKALSFSITGPSFLKPYTITYADFENGRYTLPDGKVKNLIPGTYTVTENLETAEGLLQTETMHYTLDAEVSVTEGSAKVSKDSENLAVIHLTNKYDEDLVGLTITKVFGNVPESVDKSRLNFHITGPDGYSTDVTYAAFTNGSYTLTGLRQGEYTVTETNEDETGVIPGYRFVAAGSVTEAKTEVTAAGGEVKLTNNYEPVQLKLTVIKSFNDASLADFSDLSFRIIGPGEMEPIVVYYSDFKNGQYTLPNEKVTTSLIPGKYVVYETNADVIASNLTLLSTSVTAGEVTLDLDKDHQAGEIRLRNDYKMATTSAMVMKVWDDWDNLDNSRGPITVKLTGSDGFEKEITLTEAVGWKHEETELPLYDGDNLITYTWTETSFPAGYVLANTATSGNVTVFTNKHTPELTSTTVIKIWNDKDNAAKQRPNHLRVTLYADGRKLQDFLLTESNDWSLTKDDLPKYNGGKEIQYSWSEQSVVGYTSTTKVTGNVTVFTNTYVTPPPRKPGTPPSTPEEPPVVIEDYDTPLGIEVLINHVGDCFD